MSKVAELYIISEGPDGPVKIGRSASPRGRLRELQIGNARQLRIAASYRLDYEEVLISERNLHEELSGYALSGEWFDLSEEFILEYMPDFFGSEGFEVLS